jgi:acyl-CoA synthetase (AMP-forming)/AMP-acid ligase II
VNVAGHLDVASRREPSRTALVYGEATVSYAELRERVGRIAGALTARGLRPGDRVALLQWNGPALLETLLAAIYGGFTAVPLNARSTPHEVRQIVDDAEPAVIVHAPEYTEHVDGLSLLRVSTEGGLDDLRAGAPQPLTDVAADGVAWLFYTSGTTGGPKGAMLTHRNLEAMVAAYIADIRRPASEHVVVHAAPLTHGSGLYALPALAGGATQAITTSRSFEPAELLDTIERIRATDIAFLTPTMIRWLLEEQERRPRDLASLEHVVYGGAPMYRDDLLASLATFGPVFSQIYGQAEAPVTISRLTRAEHVQALAERPEWLTSAGRPYSSVEVAVDAGDGPVPRGEGEILARGDVVMRGYWRNEEATAEALRGGWLHSGDLGSIDEEGMLYLLDRSKDMIISGGANIYPREIEEVLLEHPAVRQVAVVGAPDEEWGERVVAVVSLHPGAVQPAVEADLDALCREKLAGYKRPRRYDWLPELPTSSYGKVLKRELRARYWEGKERMI